MAASSTSNQFSQNDSKYLKHQNETTEEMVKRNHHESQRLTLHHGLMLGFFTEEEQNGVEN